MNEFEYHSIIDALIFHTRENKIKWEKKESLSCYETNIKDEELRIRQIGDFSCCTHKSKVYDLEIKTSYNTITRIILMPKSENISAFNDFAKDIFVGMGKNKNQVMLGDFKINTLNFIDEIPSCYSYLQEIIKSETEWDISRENQLSKHDSLLGCHIYIEKLHILLDIYSYCIFFSINANDNLFISSIPNKICRISVLHNDLRCLFMKYFKRDEDDRNSIVKIFDILSFSPTFITDYRIHILEVQNRNRKEKEIQKQEDERQESINNILSILKQGRS